MSLSLSGRVKVHLKAHVLRLQPPQPKGSAASPLPLVPKFVPFGGTPQLSAPSAREPDKQPANRANVSYTQLSDTYPNALKTTLELRCTNLTVNL